jgi:hypothetical protein
MERRADGARKDATMMRSWSRSFLAVLAAAASSTPAWADPGPSSAPPDRSCSCDVREGAVTLELAMPTVLAQIRDDRGATDVLPAQRREEKPATDARERDFLNEVWTLP